MSQRHPNKTHDHNKKRAQRYHITQFRDVCLQHVWVALVALSAQYQMHDPMWPSHTITNTSFNMMAAKFNVY
eukprot:1791196-Amphidinium_carterae.2